MKNSLAEQYDSLYKAKDNVYGGPVPAVVKLPEYLSKGTVLDIGGGEGRNTLYLARQGYEVTITDLSKAGLSKVEAESETESLSVKIKVSDVVTDGIEDDFDAIVCTFVFHHLNTENAVRVIKEIQDHTTNGGINIITTFTNKGGLYDRNQKSGSGRYYPSADEIGRLYSGWKILFLKTRETTTHAKDKDGNRMQNQMMILIAQKS
mgnify:CR=1 FL=1